MLEQVVEALRPAVEEVLVVASAEEEPPPVCARVVVDRESSLGPLAGIREGLANAVGELVYVSATDAPSLSTAFVDAMLAQGRAAAPEVDGFVQTLAAVYPRSALGLAESLLAAGRRRPLELLEALAYRAVPARELPGGEGISGFNTPGAYLEAVRKVEPDASATLELLGRARLAIGEAELVLPVDTLERLLAPVQERLPILEDGEVSRHFRVSLDGRHFVRDASIPIGPGEHVVVFDGAAGG